MKNNKKIFTALLCAMMALALSACGKSEQNDLTNVSETTVGDVSYAEGVAKWDFFPEMYIHYEDADYDASAQLTRASDFTWMATRNDGTRSLAAHDGVRPYQMDDLCEVTLADTSGSVRLAMFNELMLAVENAEFYAAEELTDLTLTAYPFDKKGKLDLSDESAQSIPVTNGCFRMLVGKYYYELTMARDGGYLTYGFIANRINRDKYLNNYFSSGGITTLENEDPDMIAKNVPSIKLSRPLTTGKEWRIGLSPRGEIRKHYTNQAGTEITLVQNGSAMTAKDLTTIDTVQLTYSYTVELEPSPKVQRAYYNRYDRVGGQPEGDVEFRDGDTITFAANSYYLFTVIYEDGSAQYVLKTGDAEITPHGSDDPSIDPETALHLRTEYMRHFGYPRVAAGTYIREYFGNYSGVEIAFYGSDDGGLMVTFERAGGYEIRFPSTEVPYCYFDSRFCTISEAYEAGWLTQSDIYNLGVRINGERFTQAYPTPPTEANGGNS